MPYGIRYTEPVEGLDLDAYFYTDGDYAKVDHSPETLGIKVDLK